MTDDKMDGGIAVLISGRGSNLRAILRSAAGAKVAAVVSDNPQAAGLQIAEEYGKPVFVVAPEDFSSATEWAQKLAELLRAARPQVIALAGFMRILPPPLVREFAGRMVNIHPSLLPQFPGLHTHARALAAGAQRHGCTAHYVSEKVDGGEIIAQREVAVLPGDDEDALAARVLEQEHLLYPQVLSGLLGQ